MDTLLFSIKNWITENPAPKQNRLMLTFFSQPCRHCRRITDFVAFVVRVQSPGSPTSKGGRIAKEEDIWASSEAIFHFLKKEENTHVGGRGNPDIPNLSELLCMVRLRF